MLCEIEVTKIENLGKVSSNDYWSINGQIWYYLPIQNTFQEIVAGCQQLYVSSRLIQAILIYEGKRYLGIHLTERPIGSRPILSPIKSLTAVMHSLSDDCRQQIASILFLRFLLGLKIEGSLSILQYQGKQIVISEKEVSRSKLDLRLVDFNWYIKTSKTQPELLRKKNVICINSREETLRMLGEISRNTLYDFTKSIREMIRGIDEEYIGIASKFYNRLSDLIDFKMEEKLQTLNSTITDQPSNLS